MDVCGRWFVYLVCCRDQSLYAGITTDLERRLEEHNSGIGSAYTRAKRPVRLVFQEIHPSRSAALKREAQIKRLSRAAKKHLLFSQIGAEQRIMPPWKLAKKKPRLRRSASTLVS